MNTVQGSWASSENARRTMRANKRRDTGPEMRIRRVLHRRGFRYRVDVAPIEGVRRRADLVFTRARIAVFVDGCFWHGCSEHYIEPKANSEYWKSKISTNQSRDDETNRILGDSGWLVIRAWEHEDIEEVAERISAAWWLRTGR